MALIHQPMAGVYHLRRCRCRLVMYHAVLWSVLIISIVNIEKSRLLPVAAPPRALQVPEVPVVERPIESIESINKNETSVIATIEAVVVPAALVVPSSPRHPHPLTVDILSVGSRSRPQQQEAQERTFGRHAAVRHVIRLTEATDADGGECAATLTMDDIDEIVRFCATKPTVESRIAQLYRSYQFKPKRHVGWMCAQKRPIEGLYNILQQYQSRVDDTNGSSINVNVSTKRMKLPNYLFIVDDDTYFPNMDALLRVLLDKFDYMQPHVVAGCNTRLYAFTFPYGGFGTFLTQTALERLMQPIYCHTTDTDETNVTKSFETLSDSFTRLACWRLELSELGERPFFRDGMSVADLMFRYSTEQPFTNLSTWRNDESSSNNNNSSDGTQQQERRRGYCLHSDHALGYFMAAYHISVPESDLKTTNYDSLRKRFKYTALTTENHSYGRQGECSHERDVCQVDHLVCHYMEPEQMDSLYQDGQQAHRTDKTSTAAHRPESTEV